ncbi:MAG: energy transducer TonB [Myxococcaceae bacterium]
MATAATDIVWDRRSDRTALYALLFIVGSVMVHASGFYLLDKYVKTHPPPVVQKPVDLVMIDVRPPPPKEEPKKDEPPPPPPKKVKPPPVKVAMVKPVEIPKEVTPPPPNEEVKDPPKKVVPVVVGISMSSTTANGAFAAPVGNTMYGKTADKAVKAEDVKPYSAPKYLPAYQVDSQPEVSGEVKVPYPEEARKAEIEGTVLMKVTIDNEGKVVDVKLLKGVGYGLDEAAMAAMKRFKFKPAIKGGEAVSTTITYPYNFELP